MKKLKSMKTYVKIIRYDNASKKKTLKEDCAENFEQIYFKMYITRHFKEKWHGGTGILYNLLLDPCYDDASGTTLESQDWTIDQMRGNCN